MIDETRKSRRRIKPRFPARREVRRGPAYAALDLGTNNCRLLIAEPAGRGFRVVDAFSRIVRLGEGLERRRRLSAAAIERTIGALKVCAAKMRRRRVVSARNVATEACRRAENCDSFLTRVKAETGLAIEIISADEEAELALAGCAPLFDAGYSHGLVFDIGGGSTELMWVRCEAANTGFSLVASASLPFGVVNLSERHGYDRMPREVYEAMVAKLTTRLQAFDALHGMRRRIGAGGVQMLGTSGTVTTLAAIHLGLPSYDRSAVDGSYLNVEDIEAVNRRLLGMDHRERVAEPCIGPARADLVLAGCAILETILRTWPVARLRVADRGVREGILLSLMGDAGPGPLAAGS